MANITSTSDSATFGTKVMCSDCVVGSDKCTCILAVAYGGGEERRGQVALPQGQQKGKLFSDERIISFDVGVNASRSRKFRLMTKNSNRKFH